MSSLLANKQSGGQIKINDDVLTEALSPNGQHNEYIPDKATHTDAKRLDDEMDAKNLIRQDKINLKIVKMLHENFDPEFLETRNLYNPLLESYRTILVQEFDRFMQHRDLVAQRKYELLSRVWNEKVYDTIQTRVKNCLNSQEFHRRTLNLHQEYLDYINKKGIVFLHTLDPHESYARSLRHHIRYHLKNKKRNIDGVVFRGTSEEKLNNSNTGICDIPLPAVYSWGNPRSANKDVVLQISRCCKFKCDSNIFVKEMNIPKKQTLNASLPRSMLKRMSDPILKTLPQLKQHSKMFLRYNYKL